MIETVVKLGGGLVAHAELFDAALAAISEAPRRRSLLVVPGGGPFADAVRDVVGRVLLYAPVVRREDLAASIAYLSRRLDENTSPENFLRAAFTLEPGIYIPDEALGVRIEDDVLITAQGPVWMSAGAPRTTADIERLMRGNATARR